MEERREVKGGGYVWEQRSTGLQRDRMQDGGNIIRHPPTAPGSGLSKCAGFGAFTEAGKIRGQGGSREVGSETGREK